jgi:hypothetical protein
VLVAEFVQPKHLPKLQAQPDITEASTSFRAYQFDPHGDRLGCGLRRIEQLPLLRISHHVPRQRRRLRATFGIEFSKMGYYLLLDIAPLPYRAHEPSIGVNLPTLLDRRVPEIHAVNSDMEISRRPIQNNPLGWHYTASIDPLALSVDLNLDTWPSPRRPSHPKKSTGAANCGSWVSTKSSVVGSAAAMAAGILA